MTEQELTALAQILSGEGWRTIAPDPIVTPPAAQKVIRQMSSGYLTLKAERDALKERLALEQFKNSVPPTDQPTDDDVEVEL